MKESRTNPFSTTARSERRIKISPDLAAALQGQMNAFRDKFGREPGPGDPLFFDPDADQPLFRSEAQMNEMEDEMCAVMVSTGIDPAFIYAFRKTGRILTTENMKYLTREEMAEWNDAIEEYQYASLRPRKR
jgi:integrase